MLSNVISAGKGIANKLTNKFLNLSEIEVKIKTATNDDNWGPNGSLMKEIADETFSTTNFQEVMTFLWYRIFTEKPPNNRRTYKGLVLLSYLIVNGSDLVAASCKAHLYEIMRLKSYVDCHGVADIAIRKKASNICDLLSDSQRLTDDRKRAKSYQTRYYQSESVTGVDAVDSNQINAQSLGNIDDWDVGSKSLPYAIGESFMNFVNTFTQNISGPPPTETHDNFDIPMNYEITAPVENEYTCKSVKSTQPVSMEKIDSDSKEKFKEIIKKVEVIKEKPIIDFSEHEVSTNSENIDVDLLFALQDKQIDKDIDEEFGNLRSWDNPDNLINITNNNTSQLNISNHFTPNFDMFARPNVNNNQIPDISSIPLSNSQPQPNANNSSLNTPKSDKKIGSTWSEIDALNIDLNNLCGRKHLYSKS